MDIENNCCGADQPESAVRSRYSQAAQAVEPSLCCPVDYSQTDLDHIPQEVIERDYGCGNPAPYVRSGDTVLDLGSGGGKICFIASRLVGAEGQVIGVDCNPEMLALARRSQPEVAGRLGFDNVRFRYGLIQDLQLDLERLAEQWGSRPLAGPADWLALRDLEQQLRREQPMIADHSVDCVVSNCVLNLVRNEDRQQLFEELFRVLREGGRVAISDIVSDELVPQELQRDGRLWSGCISGAYREDHFLNAFRNAGFQGIEIVSRDEQPWQTVAGIEFRSMTVTAVKPESGPCLERRQAVIYKGPFARVTDDDGNTYQRGQRAAVCDKFYRQLQQPPFQDHFLAVPPHQEVPLAEAGLFDCSRDTLRDPEETKLGSAATVGPRANDPADASSLPIYPATGCCGSESQGNNGSCC